MQATVPTTIYIVNVEDRMDGVYAFTSRVEALRFHETVLRGGSYAEASELPLNLSPEHTDDLIQAEAEANE